MNDRRKYPIQEFSLRASEAAHPHRQELGHFFQRIQQGLTT
jgi:hypothetical protein